MPIHVVWDNPEKTIVRLDYEEPVSNWKVYDDAVDESYALARSVNHPVYVIHNAGRVNMPKGSAFPHIQRGVRLTPPNVVYAVPIVENMLARTILLIILKPLLGNKIRPSASLKDAREMVARDMAAVQQAA
jgi:hypothetical protein